MIQVRDLVLPHYTPLGRNIIYILEDVLYIEISSDVFGITDLSSTRVRKKGKNSVLSDNVLSQIRIEKSVDGEIYPEHGS